MLHSSVINYITDIHYIQQTYCLFPRLVSIQISVIKYSICFFVYLSFKLFHGLLVIILFGIWFAVFMLVVVKMRQRT